MPKAEAKIAVRAAKKKDHVEARPKVITIRTNGPVSYPNDLIPAPEPTTEEERKAVSDFDTARIAVAKQLPGDRVSEMRYSLAYQRLVQLGLAPQLRRKYR